MLARGSREKRRGGWAVVCGVGSDTPSFFAGGRFQTARLGCERLQVDGHGRGAAVLGDLLAWVGETKGPALGRT